MTWSKTGETETTTILKNLPQRGGRKFRRGRDHRHANIHENNRRVSHARRKLGSLLTFGLSGLGFSSTVFCTRATLDNHFSEAPGLFVAAAFRAYVLAKLTPAF